MFIKKKINWFKSWFKSANPVLSCQVFPFLPFLPSSPESFFISVSFSCISWDQILRCSQGFQDLGCIPLSKPNLSTPPTSANFSVPMYVQCFAPVTYILISWLWSGLRVLFSRIKTDCTVWGTSSLAVNNITISCVCPLQVIYMANLMIYLSSFIRYVCFQLTLIIWRYWLRGWWSLYLWNVSTQTAGVVMVA